VSWTQDSGDAQFRVSIVQETDAFEALQKLAVVGSADPAEALQKLAVVGSADPAEALQGLATTVVLPYEALAKLAASAGDPYEALQALAATVADPYEALQKLAVVGSGDPYEALQKLAVVGSADPAEALQKLAVTVQAQLEALKALAAVGNQDALEALQTLALVGNQDALEALQGLAATALEPFASSQTLAVARGTGFEVLQAIKYQTSPNDFVIPDSIAAASNLSGAVGAIQEDPNADDGQWLTATSPGNDTAVRVTFASPVHSLDPTRTQTVSALVRATGANQTPTARLDIYENGVLVQQGTPVTITSTSGQVISTSFQVSQLSDPTGAGVEARVVGTAG
jgi:hypothetical protein